MKPILLLWLAGVWLATGTVSAADSKPLRAGAAKVDITPTNFPVIVNGGFLEKQATQANDPLHARAIVLDDGATRIAICVVDTCMMMRELIDDAKERINKATGIATDRMLISATHTHSAPSSMACLGVRMDPVYARFLTGKIVDVVVDAASKLQDARIGWSVTPAWGHTNCRRWILRPDKMITDPFGEVSARANMHPGYLNPDAVGPSGPIDPDLSLLSIQTRDGKPMALLANFSMHYFGGAPISADYFGKFADGVGQHIGALDSSAFIGIMSQGTSGDSHWMDYSRPKKTMTSEQYADGLMKLAAAAVEQIEYLDTVPIAMAEAKLTLGRRLADEKRLQASRKIVEAMGDRIPKNREEVYAIEQLLIKDAAQRELKLQAVRIGGLGITAMPNEVFAITGLKLKAQSPLRPTFNIELANGGDGYIPPPEQHKLGGYTTWAARTAGLVPEAEPKIVETVLGLLEQVSGEKRRAIQETHGKYAQAVLASEPAAYWRLNEFNPPVAMDCTLKKRHAIYEDGIAMYLPGAQSRADGISDVPERPSEFSGDQINRAPHFAGGRIVAKLPELGQQYSVEFWFWNGLANDLRPVTAYLLSRGIDGDPTAAGDHLGIGGTSGGKDAAGKLFFYNGNQRKTRLSGGTPIAPRSWHHVVLSRDGRQVAAYLDGKLEIEGEADWVLAADAASIFLGGRCDRFAGLEGKLDEVAVYSSVLTAEDIARHYQAADRPLKAELSATEPPLPARSNLEIPIASKADAAPEDKPLTADESLRKLHLPAGFKAEIVASEPLLLDPVAFDWDERGRLWVVEMADYPLGMDGNGQPGGRIRVLEDHDGDGHYEKSRLFADGLNFPNGILTWRDGVIISAAPEILFLQDTDGDGRMDKQEVLISGLLEGNQQLRANSLRWGLDNWVYVAAGSPNAKRFGGELKLTSTRLGREIFVGGRDYRFRPDTGQLEPASGPTQFGRNRDNWGHWFGTQNSNPLWHYVLPEQYLQRNPYFGANQTVVQLLAPQNPPVYPASTLEKRFHSFTQSGHYTSACGGVIYRDQRMFQDSDTHAFVCEPFHNLIQHTVLADNGVTFTAKVVLGDGKFDFFASEDRWCRPVMVREGPDGALWIADMYRYMIEHPQFLPQAGKDEMLPHYRRGDDRGRIYRVSRLDMPRHSPVRFDNLSTVELVKMLDTSNGWIRDKAHQVLLWRADEAALEPLLGLAERSQNPLARLHALCVLDGLGKLAPSVVAHALTDAHSGVRMNALRLAETRLTPEVLVAAVGLADDQDAKVLMQLAFLLGESREALAGETLGRLLVKHAGDPMLFAAAMTSATPHLRALIAAVTSESTTSKLQRAIVEALLTNAIGLKDREAIASLLAPTFTAKGEHYTADQLVAFASVLDQLAQQSISLDQLRTAENDNLSRLLDNAATMHAQAREAASDESIPALERIAAASLMSRDPAAGAEALSKLTSWLDPQHSADIQVAAIRALTGIDSPQVTAAFAKAWPTMTPTTRLATLGAWMSRERWAFNLLQRLERNEIHVSTLDPTNRARLIKHESKRISQLAAKVFDTASSSRSKVLEGYRPALSLTGDPARGQPIFIKACAACHKRGSEGRLIGPDMASVVEHPPEKLLISILDPSADIQPGFNPYNCLLNTGEQIYGLLVSESANSVVMLLNDGTRKTVLRNQIELLKGQNISFMPEGLETVIDHQQMADLIAFLRQPIDDGIR